MKLNGNSHNGGEHSQHDAQNETRSPEPSPAPAKKHTARKVLLIILAVILALAAAVAIHFLVAGHFFWEQPIALDAPAPTKKPAATPAPTAKPQDQAAEITLPEETQEPEQTPEPEDEGEAPVIPPDAERKEGVYTFLLAGVDRASNSTDTIIVASFDTVNHKATLTNIPRDTLINIGWATTPKKINAVYPGYINSGKDGMEGLKDQVKNLLGFEVDRYITVYLNAVEDAVNAIGGVWYDVPRDMYYEDYVQDLLIEIKAGYQLLNGKDALGYCRFRADYAGGDIQRIGVQQDFLKAVASQMISLGSIPHLPELIDVIMRDVDTDLTAANMAWLARQFLACKSEDIVFQTAPCTGNGINGISFVGLDVGPWLEMVNASINPYKTEVTTANVNILTFNYGGMYLGSTTGMINGGWDSFYCLSCTGKSGKATYHAPGAHLDFGESATE